MHLLPYYKNGQHFLRALARPECILAGLNRSPVLSISRFWQSALSPGPDLTFAKTSRTPAIFQAIPARPHDHDSSVSSRSVIETARGSSLSLSPRRRPSSCGGNPLSESRPFREPTPAGVAQPGVAAAFGTLVLVKPRPNGVADAFKSTGDRDRAIPGRTKTSGENPSPDRSDEPPPRIGAHRAFTGDRLNL